MMTSFGQYLNKIRKDTKAAEIAKKAGISNVYLLDIEKGQRSAPKGEKLIKLIDSLDATPHDRKRLFDLAAKERDEIPADVIMFMKENKCTIELIRMVDDGKIPLEYITRICEKYGDQL